MKLFVNNSVIILLYAIPLLFIEPTIVSAQVADSAVWAKMGNQTATFYKVQEKFNQYWDGRVIEKGKGFKPFKRWEAYMEPRVYPSGNMSLPSSNYANYLAWSNSNANIYQSPSLVGVASSGVGSWIPLGPFGKPGGPVNATGAGRINFVRFAPGNSEIMYVGAPDGGLWKSMNGGINWTTNNDFLTVIGCSDLAIDPENTNIMYLATGDLERDRNSMGILKSTDGGSSWSPTSVVWNAADSFLISKLLIHPANPLVMIAATNHGIFKTTDGWNSFTTGNFPAGPLPDLKDMEFRPGIAATIYAAGTSFWRSVDTGNTWTNTASGLPSSGVSRIALGVTAADSNYVYALLGNNSDWSFLGLYRSTDSGNSFTLQSSSPNLLGYSVNGSDLGGQAWYDLAIAVSPTDKKEVIVGGVNQWRSTNEGLGGSWHIISHWSGEAGHPFVHADVHELQFLPGSGNTYFSCNDGGIFKTTDSGATWTDLSNNLAIAQQNEIGLSASDPQLFVAGHQDNGTNLSEGLTWTNIYGGDGGDCFFNRTNDDTIFYSYVNGFFLRSNDGGIHRDTIMSGLFGNADFYSRWYQDPVSSDILYAAGRNRLFKSFNKGNTWSALDFGDPSRNIKGIAVAPSNTARVYVIYNNSVWRSNNGGVILNSNITGSLPVGLAALTDIIVSNTNSNKIWVSFSGYSAGNKIFRSDDGGSSWINISAGLPNLPVNSLVYVNNSAHDEIYVGADIGVYAWNDTLTSCMPFFNQLPHCAVKDLEIFYPTRKLRAATYGRGSWETSLFPVASVTITVADSMSINCLNPTLTFSATAINGGNTPAYQWRRNGINVGANSSIFVTSTFNNGDTITCVMTSSLMDVTGSPDTSNEIKVHKNKLPSVLSYASPSSVCLGNSGQLLANANSLEDDTLFTSLDGAYGFQGNVFDIAAIKTIHVNSIQMNIENATAAEIWFKQGGYGNADITSNAGWTKLGSTVSISSAGKGNLTSIPMIGLTIPAGQTMGIMVVCNGLAYSSNGNNVGSVLQSNTDMVIKEGHGGNGFGGMFAMNHSPYTWNGRLLYKVDNTIQSYVWSASTGVNIPSTPSPNIMPNATTVYTVTVTDGNQCTSSATTEVVVNPLPALPVFGGVTATPSSICLGSAITLDHNLFLPGCETQTGFEGVFTPVSVFYGQSGSMYGGHVILGSVPDKITLVRDNDPLWYGSPDAYYRLQITCNGTVIFHWTFNTTDSPYSAYPVYYSGNFVPHIFPHFNPGLSGNQSGTDTVGVFAGDYLYFSSAANYPNGVSQTVIENLTGPFFDTYTVNWYDTSIGGTPVSSVNYGLYNLNPPSAIAYRPDSNGTFTYYAELVSPYTGCASHRIATSPVTVHRLPELSSAAVPLMLCKGDSTQITTFVNPATPVINYEWTPTDGLNNSAIANPKASPLLPTVYQLKVTDVFGCSDSLMQNVYVKPLPVLSTASASPVSLCEGEPVSLTYATPLPSILCNGALQFSFKKLYASANWTLASVNSYNDVVVGGVDSSAIYFTLPASGSGLSGAGYTNYTITAPCDGIISFDWLYSFGTANVEMPRFSVNGGPFQNFTGFDTAIDTASNLLYNSYQTGTCNIAIQAGQTFALQAYTSDNFFGGFMLDITNFKAPTPSLASQTVTWNDAPAGGTDLGFGNPKTVTPPVGYFTGYANVRDGFLGCYNPVRVSTNTVNVHALPQVTASADSSTICLGSAAILTAVNADTYVWNPGAPVGSSIIVTPSTTTTYTVTGTNSIGCTKTAVVTITVDTCGGNSYFSLTALGSYTWPLNGVTYTQSGTYTYTSVNGSGGVDTSVLVLTIHHFYIMIDQEISCFGSNDGSCQASSIAPFAYTSYTLDNTQTNATGYFSGLSAGSHTICATDGVVTECVTMDLSEPQALTASIDLLSSVSCQGADGALTVNVTGGTSPYTMYWTDASNAIIGYGSDISSLTPGSYAVYVTDDRGCMVNVIDTLLTSCGYTLQLKLYLQGYYLGGGLMTPALLNQGTGGSTLVADTILVELRNASSPYEVLYTLKTLLHTDGTATCSFPIAGVYYIVIRHRSGLETWSADPLTFGVMPVMYDFSSSASKAYGNNQIETDTGVFSIFSGDLNEDENIDLFDLIDMESDILDFVSGYFPTDINGDGNSDMLDLPIVENNIFNFVFSSHP